jgi:hypothetical protein
MSLDIEKMAARIAALEAKLNASDEKAEEKPVEEKKEASQRDVIASEIMALEKKFGMKASDEKVEEKVEEKEVKASLVDPKGVEEEITQDYLTEVEDLEHGTELATDDSMLDAAPTGYVAKMRSASARLDAVANYLEKTGRKQMAHQIDKIADAIDQKIASVENK